MEVRGRSLEDRMPDGQRPRGDTTGVRSGVAEGRSYTSPKVRGSSQEEPPCVRGQGRRLGRSTHVQGVVAVLAQEGPEELSHIEGQEGRR